MGSPVEPEVASSVAAPTDAGATGPPGTSVPHTVGTGPGRPWRSGRARGTSVHPGGGLVVGDEDAGRAPPQRPPQLGAGRARVEGDAAATRGHDGEVDGGEDERVVDDDRDAATRRQPRPVQGVAPRRGGVPQVGAGQDPGLPRGEEDDLLRRSRREEVGDEATRDLVHAPDAGVARCAGAVRELVSC